MAFHVQGLERHEQPNPYGYDEAAKAQKQRWLKELADLYPDVNALWREWVYDLCVNTPPDELEAMKRRVKARSHWTVPPSYLVLWKLPQMVSRVV